MVNRLQNSIQEYNRSPKYNIEYKSFPIDNIITPTHIKDKTIGKKHFSNHANFNDNVVFDMYNPYSVQENLEKVMNYYNNLNVHERNYNYSPQMYSFYKKDVKPATDRYDKIVRAVNMSQDNPYKKNQNTDNGYMVIKFKVPIDSKLKRSGEYVMNQLRVNGNK